MHKKEMIQCYIALGSNMGDRFKNIQMALDLIVSDAECSCECCSPVYRSEAMYNKNLDYFYNSVIRIKTSYSAISLLSFLKEIEIKLGRNNTETRYCARPIDLDILTYGEHVIESEELTVPHPHIKERKFVLKPWSDIDSEYIPPNTDMNINELLISTPGTSVVRVEKP